MIYGETFDVFLQFAPIFGRPSPEDAEDRLKSVLAFLEEHMLGDKEYITGDRLRLFRSNSAWLLIVSAATTSYYIPGENFTIADICIGATLTALEVSFQIRNL